MKINKYFPFVFVYFFINSVGLPFGLTWTAILAPFFYAWMLFKKRSETLLPFVALLAPFIVIQMLNRDTVRKVYLYSLVNLILVYIFCQAVYTFLKSCKDVERIFRKLLFINFAFCLIAIVLYFTPWQQWLWIEQTLTEGVENFKRLKLLTYEASYYATLFVPIFCFFMLQYLFKQNNINRLLLLAMIILPMILSFSFGVMAALLVSGILTYLIYFRTFTRKGRVFNALIYSLLLLTFAGIVIYIFFPDGFLVTRLGNIIAGTDTSGNGRTSDAFVLAKQVLQERDPLWGIGLGQLKLIGEPIIRQYYMYMGDFVPRIPNAAAETLAVFGWIGFSLRLFVQLFLFFQTRVWSNYYRFWLFLFVFIYQFTGSFITNSAEYVIWLLAFVNVFGQFNVVFTRDKALTPLPQLKPG